MADVGVVYTLSTPGGTVLFNDGFDPFAGADQFYITEIRGLAAPALRTPIDNVPLGDGGLVHDFWKGPRHIWIEGIFLIQSTKIMNSIVVIRNEMGVEFPHTDNYLTDAFTFGLVAAEPDWAGSS